MTLGRIRMGGGRRAAFKWGGWVHWHRHVESLKISVTDQQTHLGMCQRCLCMEELEMSLGRMGGGSEDSVEVRRGRRLGFVCATIGGSWVGYTSILASLRLMHHSKGDHQWVLCVTASLYIQNINPPQPLWHFMKIHFEKKLKQTWEKLEKS